MLRIFISDGDRQLRAFNLAKPWAFGMVSRNLGTDPDYINEYEFIEDWYEVRLANEQDLDALSKSSEGSLEINLNSLDFEDASEVANGVVVFRDDGDEARYFEAGGYYTVVPQAKAVSNREHVSLLAEVSNRINTLDIQYLKPAVQIVGELRSLMVPGHRDESPDLDHEAHLLPETISLADRPTIRKWLEDNGIDPIKEWLRPGDVATLTDMSTWYICKLCREGKISTARKQKGVRRANKEPWEIHI